MKGDKFLKEFTSEYLLYKLDVSCERVVVLILYFEKSGINENENERKRGKEKEKEKKKRKEKEKEKEILFSLKKLKNLLIMENVQIFLDHLHPELIQFHYF